MSKLVNVVVSVIFWILVSLNNNNNGVCVATIRTLQQQNDNNKDDDNDDGKRVLFAPLGTRRWSASYRTGQRAAFGNPLSSPNRTYNVMIPPDDRALCEYPRSLSNVTTPKLTQFPDPIALLVSLKNCSAEHKARVALEIQRRLTPQLQLLLVYDETRRDETTLAQLVRDDDDNNNNNNNDLDSIGVVFVDEFYGSRLYESIRNFERGIDFEAEPRYTWINRDAVFATGPLNAEWYFPLHLVGYDEALVERSHYSGLGRGPLIFVLVLVWLFFVVVGCAHCLMCWFAFGGAFRWRRNDVDKRITGVKVRAPVLIRRCCCRGNGFEDEESLAEEEEEEEHFDDEQQQQQQMDRGTTGVEEQQQEAGEG